MFRLINCFKANFVKKKGKNVNALENTDFTMMKAKTKVKQKKPMNILILNILHLNIGKH